MASIDIIQGRVARLRELMAERGYDAVVLRNNPDLRWLTGATRAFDDEVAHTAFVTAEGLWLHTDSRYYNTFVERGVPELGWKMDQDVIDAPAWIAARVGESRARVVAVESTMDLGTYDQTLVELKAAGLAALLPRLHGELVDMRAVKDAEELVELRAAQRVTDEAFTHICGFIKAGMTEQEIRVELETYMLSHGADSLSFETIIAAGPNGANPHARPGSYVVKEGDFIVMDYGAGVNDYHADMTRTVCVGQPTDEMRTVYDIVRRANEECQELARTGAIGKDVYDHSMRVIADAGYGDYYGHGLGHGVGIEIHEEPNFNRRNTKPVPEGAVITIEPGIYLPGKFGVRIEDCGLITASGYEAFGTSTHDLVCVGK